MSGPCHQSWSPVNAHDTAVVLFVEPVLTTTFIAGCKAHWDHDSWGEVIELLITTFLALLFSMIAFAFYRQLLDPASPANASRAPSNEFRSGK